MPTKTPAQSFSPGDIRAGIIVFFVALPLCLGIATASGAPPIAGVIAGVVGGLLVGALSGSPLSVSGPAAGLTVIVLEAIQALGFRAFLLATMLAGGLQFTMGVLKLGRLGQFVPNTVIRGMLAAIGLILVLKQLPHAFGYDPDFEGDFAFQQPDGENTLSALAHSFVAVTPGAVIIALCAGFTLFAWRDYGKLKLTRVIPRELAAVGVGLAGSLLFIGTSFELAASHRVTLPMLSQEGGLAALWVMPDFSAITNPAVWKTAVTLAIVASIETLLCIEATDRLDPEQRVTPTNRELIAQGAGNATSGLLGGLPLTSVVVRSFTNVQAGGRSRWAAIIHGALLLVAALALASILNHIPLAALAAVLIMVGLKLTPPRLYRDIYRLGYSQFTPFIATIGFIVFTDLLTGTLCGMAFALFFTLWQQYRSAIIVTDDGDYRMIRFTSNVTFLHKARLKQALASARPGGHVVLDGTRAASIDHDVLEILRELEGQGAAGNVKLSFRRSPAARNEFFREGHAA